MSAQEHRTRSHKRIAVNQAVVREVNERLLELAPDSREASIVICECANPDCTIQLPMSTDEYRQVRADPIHFAAVPEHFMPDVEDVVAKNDRFWTIRKQAGQDALARATARDSV